MGCHVCTAACSTLDHVRSGFVGGFPPARGARHARSECAPSPPFLGPGLKLAKDLEPALKLMQKYTDVPMSLADACLVRLTETLADPVILTTDADFRIYR